MALTCGFYNSVDGDRKYDATQFASLFDGVITDGVVAAVGDWFGTTPGGGMVVNVGTGRAWFNRTWTYSDAKIPLTLDASDLLYDRIDAVVLEIDTSIAIRDNSIKVVKGTPAQEPQKPALTDDEDVHQYALAYVQVRASTIEIGAGDITINVGQEDCPFVTSIVETPELGVLFARWEAQFNEWFENVQSQLEGDIAANLQRQIDANKTAIEGLRKDTDEKIETLASDDTLTIGDLLYTARSNVDKRFLLCNGAAWSRDMYPILADMFPSTITDTWNQNIRKKFASFPNDNRSPVGCGCVYVNGKMVYMSCCLKDEVYKGQIHYSDSVAGGYSDVEVISNSKIVEFNRLVYINGYYVICGHKENAATIWYATDPAGPWAATTVKAIKNLDSIYAANDIAFDGTNYIIAGKVYDYNSYGRGVIWHSKTLNSSSWTEKELWKSGNSIDSMTQALTVACGNGQIVVGGIIKSIDAIASAIRSYSSSINLEFINKEEFSSSSNIVSTNINIARYLNSKFVYGGQKGNKAFISISDDMYFMGTVITVWQTVSETTLRPSMFHGVHALDYDANEKQYIFGGVQESEGDAFSAIVGRIAEDLNTNKIQTNVLETDRGTVYSKNKINGIAATSDRKYAAAYNIVDAYMVGKYIRLDQFDLPTISADKVHVYIKAKEDV